jgi:protoporphyrin/coproporphyrin ferrochelatase
MNDRKNIGVVLLQLGGPERLEAVEPFLYNLFCDPEIINFPGATLARRPLAKWISKRRAKIAREHYKEIGGGSPILELTNRQARALAAILEPHADARVVVAMRYWHPLTGEAIAQLEGLPLDALILLPLYPHYSFATTGSSMKEWQRLYRGDRIPVRAIHDYHDHPLYIDAVTEKIEEALRRIPNPDEVYMLFSAHGLPMSLIEKGDPYRGQIEATVRLVLERGGWKNHRTLCFQSRVGRQKWLEPSLTQTVERLAKAGVRRMLVIPISFVTDHIETLHEINIEAREQAEKLRVTEFHIMASLNDSPTFIRALADLVARAAELPADFS